MQEARCHRCHGVAAQSPQRFPDTFFAERWFADTGSAHLHLLSFIILSGHCPKQIRPMAEADVAKSQPLTLAFVVAMSEYTPKIKEEHPLLVGA